MRNIRGFTLIELIIAIVVIGVIAAAATPVMIASMGAYNATLDTAMTLDKLRYASERMIREIRDASAGTLNMSATAPQYTRDDYLTSGTGTTKITRVVTITQSAGNVNLSYSTPTVTPTPVLTDQLSALNFAYYDASGASTVAAGEVRFVEINLTLILNGQLYAQRTRVALRNH